VNVDAGPIHKGERQAILSFTMFVRLSNSMSYTTIRMQDRIVLQKLSVIVFSL
jgi:hypothetical protein